MFTLFIYLSVYQPYDQILMQSTANYILKLTLIRVKATKEKIRKQKKGINVNAIQNQKNSNIVHHYYILYKPI